MHRVKVHFLHAGKKNYLKGMWKHGEEGGCRTGIVHLVIVSQCYQFKLQNDWANAEMKGKKFHRVKKLEK